MIETIDNTVKTPTVTPSIVSAERSLFALNVEKAITADSLMSSNVINHFASRLLGSV